MKSRIYIMHSNYIYIVWASIDCHLSKYVTLLSEELITFGTNKLFASTVIGLCIYIAVVEEVPRDLASLI